MQNWKLTILRLQHRPQVIAANKTDLIYSRRRRSGCNDLKAEFEPKGIRVFPISGATGNGISELFILCIRRTCQDLDDTPIVFEQEYFPEDELII